MDELTDRALVRRMLAGKERAFGAVLGLCVLLVAVAGCGCKAVEPPAAPTPSARPTTAGRHLVAIVGGGVTLGGILFRPDAPDPRPALVVLHGWQPAGTNGAATVGWLRMLAGVAADRVGIVGFSQGGQVALLAAARDRGIRAGPARGAVARAGRPARLHGRRGGGGPFARGPVPGRGAAIAPCEAARAWR